VPAADRSAAHRSPILDLFTAVRSTFRRDADELHLDTTATPSFLLRGNSAASNRTARECSRSDPQVTRDTSPPDVKRFYVQIYIRISNALLLILSEAFVKSIEQTLTVLPYSTYRSIIFHRI